MKCPYCHKDIDAALSPLESLKLKIKNEIRKFKKHIDEGYMIAGSTKALEKWESWLKVIEGLKEDKKKK